jgi:putative transposase
VPVNSSASGTRTGSVRLRLKPTNVQAGTLLRAAGARRFAFNWALGQIKANQDQWAAEASDDIPRLDRTRPFSYFDLVRAWDATKNTLAPWHRERSVWTFRYGIHAAHTAHSRFLKGQARFPKFKARRRDRPRFTVTDGLHLQAGRVRVAKYGWVALGAPCRAQAKLRRLLARGRARMLNITVSRDAGGSWLRVGVLPADHDHGARGVPPAHRRRGRGGRRSEDRRGRSHQRRGARRDPGSLPRATRCPGPQQTPATRPVPNPDRSANRAKARRRLGRVHARVGAVRTSRLHQFTAQLAKSHGLLVVENIATANLMRNHHLAQAIGDQGWGELARQFGYKTTTRYGGTLVVADRWFPSNKTCSACGAVKPKLPLAVRTYRCEQCDLVIDRDTNAAANLAAWGEQQQGTRPVAGTRAGDRHPGGPSAQLAEHACEGATSRSP